MPNLRFAAPKERRVALVTGGARGLGRASALRIAEEGRDIVIADVLEEQGQATVEEVKALGQRALYLHTDVTDEAAVHATVQQAVEHFGRLDILVCCAGILGWEKPFLEQTPAQFDKVMKINVFIGALGNAYPKQNVFVNGVEPGRALTDMVVPRFTPEFLANPGNPMGRYSDPEEVAEVVEFLTSERNTYTTGSVWSVKGATG
jgi:NAD(P)-dependent dehydrogenase (short-subunit alcohol dehydrogenase family)